MTADSEGALLVFRKVTPGYEYYRQVMTYKSHSTTQFESINIRHADVCDKTIYLHQNLIAE